MNTAPLRMSYASFGRCFFPRRLEGVKSGGGASRTSTAPSSALVEVAQATTEASAIVVHLPEIAGCMRVVDGRG